VTTTVEIRPMTAAEKADLIAASLNAFLTSLHHADVEHLQVEAARIEAMRPSPLIKRMRDGVEAEQRARRAVQLLAELGDTADAVADRLRALEIKGAQCFSNVCPLSLYLERRGVVAYVSCEQVTVAIGSAKAFASMPKQAGEFVLRFDGGLYLDLIDAELTGEAGCA